jgi:hypothetical protein
MEIGEDNNGKGEQILQRIEEHSGCSMAYRMPRLLKNVHA